MNEATSGRMRDCVCGHEGALHEWEARIRNGYIRVGPCSWTEPLPPEGDDPYVRHKFCSCRDYEPDMTILDPTTRLIETQDPDTCTTLPGVDAPQEEEQKK